MSACRSCGARIAWATTNTGKAMPLDAAPAAGGNVRVAAGSGGLQAAVLAGDELRRAQAAGELLHYPHHATCPQGRQWQKKPRVEGLHHVGDAAREIRDELRP